MKNSIFETHPNLEKVYVTSDETAFYQETDAKNHAKSLKDKAVEVVFNDSLLEVVGAEEHDPADEEMKAFEAEEKSKKEAQEKADQEAAEKVLLAEALANFDAEKTNYNDAFKLFKGLGLTAETNKKEDIYPVLVAEQTKTNTQE